MKMKSAADSELLDWEQELKDDIEVLCLLYCHDAVLAQRWKLNEDGLKYIFRETDCQHLAAASVIYNLVKAQMGWEKVRC